LEPIIKTESKRKRGKSSTCNISGERFKKETLKNIKKSKNTSDKK
jgi:hypothetical protein